MASIKSLIFLKAHSEAKMALDNGLVRFAPNPHHERAKLALMTDHGKAAFRSAMAKQRRWAKRLAEGLSVDTIADAARAVHELRQRLEKG